MRHGDALDCGPLNIGELLIEVDFRIVELGMYK
jgi:hypothetical protein